MQKHPNQRIVSYSEGMQPFAFLHQQKNKIALPSAFSANSSEAGEKHISHRAHRDHRVFHLNV